MQRGQRGRPRSFPDQFANLKAQLYRKLRELFQDGAIHGLNNELAISQLASIKWKANLRGLTQIESKDEMAKRGIRSPDRAEAIILAFADRTPGMFAYVKQKALHQQAVQAAIRQGKPPPEDPWNATQLTEAYDQMTQEIEGGRMTCPKCGGVLGSTKTMNSDGRYSHPECARGW
jgi:hypothetical protein